MTGQPGGPASRYPKPEQLSELVVVRFTESRLAALKQEATSHDVTISDVVRAAVEAWLEARHTRR